MEQTDSNQQGLYRSEFEHDSCGTGFITNINGHKSNQIILDALTILENMEHRGACGCDPLSGDGAGLLIQLPHEFFMEECTSLEISLPEPGEYGVGMIFFPKDSAVKKACRNVIKNAVEKLGLHNLGYRKVPVDDSGLGETARSAEPDVEQLFIARPQHIINVEDFSLNFIISDDLTLFSIDQEHFTGL